MKYRIDTGFIERPYTIDLISVGWWLKTGASSMPRAARSTGRKLRVDPSNRLAAMRTGGGVDSSVPGKRRNSSRSIYLFATERETYTDATGTSASGPCLATKKNPKKSRRLGA
jgi:hypothetical protein